ncbi:hypothetical protein M9978_08295 [Sphingomonas sp. MG17]|uniref:Uncharacterized protein n=1 Tax=Sphingomonas tagetis TaxID=2949092 RepID=A0A9X2HI97_9SPHN|nr:hypothetical protein [Sphingomonas tagetis]MCP3730427.1 hypothetical protein [Sphingomonas tagetis]
MTVPQKVNSMGVRAAQMMGLRRAAEMVGLDYLANGIGITKRNLRQKFDAERGLDAATLNLAADTLDARAHALMLHAEKLRCSAKGEQS